jgi:hypothetical protein
MITTNKRLRTVFCFHKPYSPDMSSLMSQTCKNVQPKKKSFKASSYSLRLQENQDRFSDVIDIDTKNLPIDVSDNIIFFYLYLYLYM